MPREGVLGSRGQCVCGFIPSSTQASAEAATQAEGRLGEGRALQRRRQEFWLEIIQMRL